MVENHGRLLEKETLMREVWNDSFVEEGNLNRTISRLRGILGEKPNEPQFIETVPRIGYRFMAEVLKLTDETIAEKTAPENFISKSELEKTETEILPKTESENSNSKFFIVGALLTAILISSGVWYLTKRKNAATEIKTIAVLPLRSLSADEDGKDLRLGLTDALITKLGNLKQIIVRPISAVTSFADASQDSLEIGEKIKSRCRSRRHDSSVRQSFDNKCSTFKNRQRRADLDGKIRWRCG